MRSRVDNEYDILFIGTKAEWMETLRWLRRQPYLPEKLRRLETVLLYKFGGDDLNDRLDEEELRVDPSRVRWDTVKGSLTWEPEAEKKARWWRFW